MTLRRILSLLMVMLAICVTVRYEMIDGRRYKVVYQGVENRLIINYFVDEEKRGKWKIKGVEIFEGGEVIKDTFPDND